MTWLNLRFNVRRVFCCHGNKSIILPFHSIFRTTPEVSTKLYVVEISKVSEKLWLINHKRADFLGSKFWIFFSLCSLPLYSRTIIFLSPKQKRTSSAELH